MQRGPHHHRRAMSTRDNRALSPVEARRPILPTPSARMAEDMRRVGMYAQRLPSPPPSSSLRRVPQHSPARRPNERLSASSPLLPLQQTPSWTADKRDQRHRQGAASQSRQSDYPYSRGEYQSPGGDQKPNEERELPYGERPYARGGYRSSRGDRLSLRGERQPSHGARGPSMGDRQIARGESQSPREQSQASRGGFMPARGHNNSVHGSGHRVRGHSQPMRGLNQPNRGQTPLAQEERLAPGETPVTRGVSQPAREYTQSVRDRSQVLDEPSQPLCERGQPMHSDVREASGVVSQASGGSQSIRDQPARGQSQAARGHSQSARASNLSSPSDRQVTNGDGRGESWLNFGEEQPTHGEQHATRDGQVPPCDRRSTHERQSNRGDPQSARGQRKSVSAQQSSDGLHKPVSADIRPSKDEHQPHMEDCSRIRSALADKVQERAEGLREATPGRSCSQPQSSSLKCAAGGKVQESVSLTQKQIQIAAVRSEPLVSHARSSGSQISPDVAMAKAAVENRPEDKQATTATGSQPIPLSGDRELPVATDDRQKEQSLPKHTHAAVLVGATSTSNSRLMSANDSGQREQSVTTDVCTVDGAANKISPSARDDQVNSSAFLAGRSQDAPLPSNMCSVSAATTGKEPGSQGQPKAAAARLSNVQATGTLSRDAVSSRDRSLDQNALQTTIVSTSLSAAALAQGQATFKVSNKESPSTKVSNKESPSTKVNNKESPSTKTANGSIENRSSTAGKTISQVESLGAQSHGSLPSNVNACGPTPSSNGNPLGDGKLQKWRVPKISARKNNEVSPTSQGKPPMSNDKPEAGLQSGNYVVKQHGSANVVAQVVNGNSTTDVARTPLPIVRDNSRQCAVAARLSSQTNDKSEMTGGKLTGDVALQPTNHEPAQSSVSGPRQIMVTARGARIIAAKVPPMPPAITLQGHASLAADRKLGEAGSNARCNSPSGRESNDSGNIRQTGLSSKASVQKTPALLQGSAPLINTTTGDSRVSHGGVPLRDDPSLPPFKRRKAAEEQVHSSPSQKVTLQPGDHSLTIAASVNNDNKSGLPISDGSDQRTSVQPVLTAPATSSDHREGVLERDESALQLDFPNLSDPRFKELVMSTIKRLIAQGQGPYRIINEELTELKLTHGRLKKHAQQLENDLSSARRQLRTMAQAMAETNGMTGQAAETIIRRLRPRTRTVGTQIRTCMPQTGSSSSATDPVTSGARGNTHVLPTSETRSSTTGHITSSGKPLALAATVATKAAFVAAQGVIDLTKDDGKSLPADLLQPADAPVNAVEPDIASSTLPAVASAAANSSADASLPKVFGPSGSNTSSPDHSGATSGPAQGCAIQGTSSSARSAALERSETATTSVATTAAAAVTGADAVWSTAAATMASSGTATAVLQKSSKTGTVVIIPTSQAQHSSTTRLLLPHGLLAYTSSGHQQPTVRNLINAKYSAGSAPSFVAISQVGGQKRTFSTAMVPAHHAPKILNTSQALAQQPPSTASSPMLQQPAGNAVVHNEGTEVDSENQAEEEAPPSKISRRHDDSTPTTPMCQSKDSTPSDVLPPEETLHGAQSDKAFNAATDDVPKTDITAPSMTLPETTGDVTTTEPLDRDTHVRSDAVCPTKDVLGIQASLPLSEAVGCQPCESNPATNVTEPPTPTCDKPVEALEAKAGQTAPSPTEASAHLIPLPIMSTPAVTATDDALNELPPPSPVLHVTQKETGVQLQWNLDLTSQHSKVCSYELFAYQDKPGLLSHTEWRKIGQVQSLPLPMACTLTQLVRNNTYHFAIRGVDRFGRAGSFSSPETFDLGERS